MSEPERSAAFEREFLDQAAKLAGIWRETLIFKRFYDEVNDRLRKGQDEYGPGSFVDAARSNVTEEGADLAAWSMLFAQADRVDEDLPEEVLMANCADYAYIAALGLLAHMTSWRIRERSSKSS